MNVLSLFDGMSCGKLALDRAGVKYDTYLASEIDQYALKISQKNNPDIIQIGDVLNIQTEYLPKIDLIIGGSPCQGFSNAGKGLAFDDPRSKLFFEFVKLIDELKPKFFLLENVRMKKAQRNNIPIISSHLSLIILLRALSITVNYKSNKWINILY